MRRLGRLLFLLIITGCLTLLIRHIWSDLLLLTQKIESTLQDARASTFYILHKEKGLLYTIAPSDQLFRFYVHAGLDPNADDVPLDLTMSYEWQNAEGKTLAEDQYVLTLRKSPLSEIVDQNEKVLLPSRFYGAADEIPSTDQTLYIDAKAVKGAERLQIGVTSVPESVRFVGVRSYHRHYRDQNELDVVWNRMSQSTKNRLAEASIYPADLLSKFERDNLLRAFWKSLGPDGVIPDDFTQSTLYVRDSGTRWREPDPITASGHIASETAVLTFELLTPGRYRFQATPLYGVIPVEADVNWQGVDRGLEWKKTVGLDTEGIWESAMEPGLVVWRSAEPSKVRVFKWVEQAWQDVTPEKRIAKRFVCSSAQPRRFALAQGKQVQPLQLNAGAFYRADMSMVHDEAGRITYRLKDNMGRMLYEGDILTNREPDPYRQFHDAALVQSRVYESVKAYIDAPPSAATLEVSCEFPSLIALYSRPYRLPLVKDYPASLRHWWKHDEKLPTWFSVKAEPVPDQPVLSNTYSLAWYLRPTPENEAMNEGDYEWRWLLSDSDEPMLERQIFHPNKGQEKTRRQARESTFYSLSDGAIRFIGAYNQAIVRPKLIYISEQDARQSIAITLNKAPLKEMVIAGRTGSLVLPPIPSGDHDIRITSGPGTRWYINQVPHSKSAYVLRSAYVMQTPTSSLALALPVAAHDQSVSLWFYLPKQEHESATALRCSASMDLEQNPLVSDFRTLSRHEFNFADFETERAYALQGRNRHYIGPLKASILIRNVPEQTARLHVACEANHWLVSAGIIAEGAKEYDVYNEISTNFD